jgi:glycyl-tRNA synthetase beta subunit
VRKIEEIHPVDTSLFQERVEQELAEAYGKASAALSPSSSVTDLLAVLESLADPINRFFDKVLVMDENMVVRNNRLGMLQQIAVLPTGVVDLSRLEGF